jgi:hypothetical protein
VCYAKSSSPPLICYNPARPSTGPDFVCAITMPGDDHLIGFQDDPERMLPPNRAPPAIGGA